MKPYIGLCAIVFAVLLLLPLSVLNRLNPDKPLSSPSSAASATAGSTKTPATGVTGSSATVTRTTSTAATPPTDADTFKVWDASAKKVVELSEREFVIGTVASEMYPTYHIEAMKAQAVAAYTYYSTQRSKARSNPDPALQGADFDDVPSSFPKTYTVEGLKERWGDKFDTYYAKVTGAVDAVFGKRLLYNGQPIFAAYHAISFGTTEDAKIVWGVEYPYLKPVASPGDSLSPNYQQTVSFSAAQFSEAVGKLMKDGKLTGDAATWLGSEVQRSSSGTVTAITVGGTTLTGKQLRQALELRSSNFTVTYKDGNFRFTVLGYGHDVGMSQYGADYMARQGSGWQEILQHYYTGVTIG